MRRVLLVVVSLVSALGIGLVYLYFAGGSGEPTTELTTPPLAAQPTATAGITSTTSSEATAVNLVISPQESEARFELDEILRGSPTHVVGVTDQVAGQIRFEPSDLSTAELSPVVINARTLATDSERRDRAIRGPVVLNSASDEFELITFTPTSIEGLEGSAETGASFEFAVSGDLTIKGVTQPTSFSVTAVWVQAERLEGSATTVVDRTDFGIGIPSVSSVAGVTEEVVLTLDFVAQTPTS